MSRYPKVLALLFYGLLTGCTVGIPDSIDNQPPAPVGQIYVVGDSLSDVGAYSGLRYTIQTSASDLTTNLVWPQRIAQAYGMDPNVMCSRYSVSSNYSITNTRSNCHNLAIGGAKILDNGTADDVVKPNISTQLAQVTASYDSLDLLLVNGGANDAYQMLNLLINSINGDNTAFKNYVRALVSSADIDRTLAADNTGASTARLYMQALAQRLAQSVREQALNKGAKRVVIANLPGFTKTPLFSSIIKDNLFLFFISPRLVTEVDAIVDAFNNQLNSEFTYEGRVMIFDFNTEWNSRLSNPRQYGFSNTSEAACSQLGVDLINMNKPCYESRLQSAQSDTGWWRNYAFADKIHPSPAMHQSLASSLMTRLRSKGWL